MSKTPPYVEVKVTDESLERLEDVCEALGSIDLRWRRRFRVQLLLVLLASLLGGAAGVVVGGLLP
jgi:hypothetical protein